MARNINDGDTIYAPSHHFDELTNYPSAFYRSNVVSQQDRTVTIQLPDGAVGNISLARCRTEIGIAIFNIGDLETETSLLDPLQKSTLQFTRLLVPDDCVYSWKIRSLKELGDIWAKHQGLFSTVIFIGHGSKNSINFANDGRVSADNLKEKIGLRNEKNKCIIFLSCNAGYKSFGGAVSKFPNCSDFIGPYQSVHGAQASLFCQSFLTSHLVAGHSIKTAFNHASKTLDRKSVV